MARWKEGGPTCSVSFCLCLCLKRKQNSILNKLPGSIQPNTSRKRAGKGVLRKLIKNLIVFENSIAWKFVRAKPILRTTHRQWFNCLCINLRVDEIIVTKIVQDGKVVWLRCRFLQNCSWERKQKIITETNLKFFTTLHLALTTTTKIEGAQNACPLRDLVQVGQSQRSIGRQH